MTPRTASCSFCRKPYTDVGPLVEGPGEVTICGECVSLCQAIIDQERRRRDVAPAVTGQSVRGTLDKLLSGHPYLKSVLTEAALGSLAARPDAGRSEVVPLASARLASALEPLLILTLALFVGFILFATLLPILEAGNVL